MDSSLFHPYDKPKFKAHVSKIDTVKSPSGKLAHDIFSLGNIYTCIPANVAKIAICHFRNLHFVQAKRVFFYFHPDKNAF